MNFNSIDIESWVLISIPLLSAFIGWLTNWLAVQMLFRPREPVLGIQGVVPRRRTDLAKRVAAVVEQELVSHQDFIDVLTSSEFIELIVTSIEERVEAALKNNFGNLPLYHSLLSSLPIQSIKAQHLEILRREIPLALSELAEKAEQEFDLRTLIEQKLLAADVGDFESIVRRVASRELKFIEALGGVVGLLVGLGQIALLSFGTLR